MSSISPAAARIPADGRSLRLTGLGDELLARQATRGSQRAFTALYERYYQPLYRYCRSIVRDDADAQDALQSTFTSALAALQRDARNSPLRPWLYRIAHNESISLLRRRKRDTPDEVVGEATAVGSSAEEEAADRARWRRVVEDLAELPERQRGALLLRELAGLSHEEIALTFGTSVGAAKQAIFEARQGLAELEEGRAMRCEEVRRRISEGDRRLLRGRRVNAHLHDCAACAAFALAIPARQSDLRALVPALPPAAAAAVLGRVIRAASPHGGASAGSAVGAATLGKAASVAGWKALATVGVLAGTAAGVSGLTHVFRHTQALPASSAAPAGAVGAGRSAGVQLDPMRPASADRLAAKHRAASIERTMARDRHRSFAAANHRTVHHRKALRNSAHSSTPASAGATAFTPAPGSHAWGSSSHSAPGQLTNHGVRRHGGVSNPHAANGHKQRSSHPYRSSQTRSLSSSSATAQSPVSTVPLTQAAGSATATVQSQESGSPTSSTVATPTASQPVTGAATQ